MSTAEVRWITGGAVVVGGLAVVSSTGPAGEGFATTVALVVLGGGVVACLVGHRVHVLRIRRDIEEREARGESLLRRVEPPPPSPPRRPVCPAAQRSRRPAGHRRSGCRWYR
jgi:hypothetical protein